MVWTSRAAKVARNGPGAAHVQGPPVPGGAANLAAKTPIRGALATGSACRLSRSDPAEAHSHRVGPRHALNGLRPRLTELALGNEDGRAGEHRMFAVHERLGPQ